jgi:hypothetical protein
MTKNTEVEISLEHPRNITSETKNVLLALIKIAEKHEVLKQNNKKDPIGFLSTRVAVTTHSQEILSIIGSKYGEKTCSELRELLDHLFDFTLLVKFNGEKHYIKLVVNYIIKDIGIYCFTFHAELARILVER